MNREKPILFSGEMVRAILDNKKSQTRRVIKPQPNPVGSFVCTDDGFMSWCDISDIERLTAREPRKHWRTARSPYRVGDRLYVKETWGGVFRDGANIILQHREVHRRYRTQERCEGLFYRATDDDPDYKGCWVSPYFMPKWASRIALEVTAVRVERVQDITDQDCYAEGAYELTWATAPGWPKREFARLWDEINGRKHPWSNNDWVWVYEFKRV